MKTTKKLLIAIFALLFVFAFIRITTSTYENIKREQNHQALPFNNTVVFIYER